MGTVRKKTYANVSFSETGQRRSSQFANWSAYTAVGSTNTGESLGTVNGHLNGRWSGGGAWFMTKTTYTYAPARLKDGTCQGPAILASYAEPWTDLAHNVPSEASLYVDGTHAINATIPTSPAFDLSVLIGELRAEGVPSAIGVNTWAAQTKRAKLAGEEYLNVEFGWLPLVRSIRDFSSAVNNGDKIFQKYLQEANHSIKKSYQFPATSNSKFQVMKFATNPAGVGPSGTGSVYQSTLQNKWFEADYVYHIPMGNGMSQTLQRQASYARKVLGVRLTPDVLWNLSPWSWAADWFGNTGDVLSNISNLGSDGLVMRHAYIMCHTIRTTEWRAPIRGIYSTRIKVEESKIRIPASPYGFGVAYNGLTPRQVAVIAALGISRW